jgi:hypothetical protein
MPKDKITILINQRPFHFDKDTLVPDDFRHAVGAPADYEVWRIVHNPDPEGQLPIDDIQITGPVQIHSGERYRVVPPGTFGVTSTRDQVDEEIEGLRQEGFVVELTRADGWINIVFRTYPLPPGFSKPATDLLVRLPISYPNGKPDMFWTDPDLTLKNGQCPQQADAMETVLGRPWRRFSWHPTSWNPATDKLRTYLEFVNRRLAMAK